jgi:hypothetical protein
MTVWLEQEYSARVLMEHTRFGTGVKTILVSLQDKEYLGHILTA